MAFDPLSDSTRKYRRGTVGVAAALLAVQAFDVSIEDVPAAGLTIKFADELLPIILAVSLGYLLIHFVIYLMDDVFNYQYSQVMQQQIIKRDEALEKSKSEFEIEARELFLIFIDDVGFLSDRSPSGHPYRDEFTHRENDPNIKEASILMNKITSIIFSPRNIKRFPKIKVSNELENYIRQLSYHSPRKDQEGLSDGANISHAVWKISELYEESLLNYGAREINTSKTYILFLYLRLYLLDLLVPLVIGMLSLASLFSERTVNTIRLIFPAK